MALKKSKQVPNQNQDDNGRMNDNYSVSSNSDQGNWGRRDHSTLKGNKGGVATLNREVSKTDIKEEPKEDSFKLGNWIMGVFGVSDKKE